MDRYDGSTALLVVDVQNDFADPGGGLSVRGVDRIIDAIEGEIEAAAAAGAPVVYTQDWHPATTPHFAKDGGIWPVHCVAGTWGAELHPALTVVGPVVRKGVDGEDGYSGFTMREPVDGATRATGLATLLRERGVVRVVVVGLATDYCVKATALDAVDLGFETLLLPDAVAAVDLEPGDGDRALRDMADAGVTLGSTIAAGTG